MKFILLFLLLVNTANADMLTAGYLTGKHIGKLDNDLNNSHPFVEIDNVMVFKNSFDRVSTALYFKFEGEYFKLRAGITTGYDGAILYKGYVREQKTFAGFLPFIVPTLEYKVRPVTFILGVMGNSVNGGIGFGF